MENGRRRVPGEMESSVLVRALVDDKERRDVSGTSLQRRGEGCNGVAQAMLVGDLLFASAV
jgi:hypothetical protein